jgi:eukaryotic-like serine/threonine-protein kinase
MLTRSRSKLLDFGLARMWQPLAAADDLTVAARTLEFRPRGILLGTIQYMAPELFEGKEADPRSDIFAFGCLLYEMVTGRHAFTGVNSREVISSIVRSPASPATTMGEEVPPALGRVLEQCLAKDPEGR